MKKLKLVSFVIFCISLAASLIFWFTQVRKGDRIGPVITMDQQELTVGLNATDEDFLQGVKAVDENDGDVTDSLVVESVSNFLGGGRRLVVYAAVDRHNNVSRANRIVQYEGYTSPKFYLKEPLCFESGGASKNDFLMQFQADILNCRVVRPKDIETTALGACYLAGLGCGIFKSEDEIKELWEADRVFEPQMDEETRENLYAQWCKAVEKSKDWL